MSEPQKTIPNYMRFILGGSAGMSATMFVQPLDLVKNRMQLSGVRRSSVTVIKEILKNEGIIAMYTGLSAGLLRQATYTTTRLGVYTWLFNYYSGEGGSTPNFFVKAALGMTAGACGSFVGTPAEVALIRMTADGRLPPEQRRNYTNVINALVRIVREEGILTLWRGAIPTMGRAMVVNAAQLASYSQAKQLLLESGYFQDNLGLFFTASMISGLITTIASMPVDIAKTRIQNMKTGPDGKPEFKGAFDVLVKMHLVLRSDSGESFTLEVLEGDTFEDLSNRLYERGKISVDLKQLSRDGREVEMTANVMDYFGTKKGIRLKEEKLEEKGEVNGGSLETHELDACNVKLEGIADLDLRPDILTPDVVPPLPLPDGEGPVPEEVPRLQPEQLQEEEKEQQLQTVESQPESGGEQYNVENLQLNRYCRLCACAIKEDANFIFQPQSCKSTGNKEDQESEDTLADKINDVLPILVSKEDQLPKQVCLSCVESLNASYEFYKKVSSADEALKKMLYQEGKLEASLMSEDEKRCPLCCEGSMESVSYKPEEQTSSKEEDEMDLNEEESMDQPWGNGDIGGEYDEYEEYNEEEENSYVQPKKRGRPRGSRSLKRQYPWDDLDDEDWTLKEETVVKKRGRPKGSKNKTNQQEQPAHCGLCYTWHSDVTAVLAHTLEVHCVDETGTFPCPLCKEILPDEGELIHHVINHNPTAPAKVKIWACPLCGQVYDGQDELGVHLLSDHVQAASPQYQCPLCDHAPTSGSRLANHITDSHCGPPTWSCPLCEDAHEGKQSALDHVVRSHVSMAAQTTQCPLCEMQFVTDEDMAQHLLDRHASPSSVERPSHYTCPACGSRFKTQFNLVKHTCPVRNNKKNYKKPFTRY